MVLLLLGQVVIDHQPTAPTSTTCRHAAEPPEPPTKSEAPNSLINHIAPNTRNRKGFEQALNIFNRPLMKVGYLGFDVAGHIKSPALNRNNNRDLQLRHPI
jgi:hypothetical protein